MKKDTIILVISYALVMLFVYTALSKLMTYSFYLSDLKRSPQLGAFAEIISIVVPTAEILAAGLLIIDRTRLLGLYTAFLLMLIFTGYVAWVLAFAEELPCSCGGIIRELSWPNHLILNIVFLISSIFGIILQRKKSEEISNKKIVII